MRIVTLAAVVALVAGSAAAQEIGAWDVNSDGLLDEAEFTDGFLGAGVFDRWDLDDDELIGFSELSSGLYGLWNADGDGELSVSEWDDAVDLWFGEQSVNLSAEAWDENGDGIISEAEFAEGLQQTDLLARLDTAEGDGMLEQEEFASGLFDVADGDDDELLGEEEGLLTTITEFLVPAEDDVDSVTDDEVLEDEETFGDEEGIVEDEVDEESVVFDEVFTQLPVPCGGEGGSCEDVAQRFCETLGYGEPIAFLDVEGSLYAIRCENEI